MQYFLGDISDNVSINENNDNSDSGEAKFNSDKSIDNDVMSSDENESITEGGQFDDSFNPDEKGGTWEDIYGRLRTKEGSVITVCIRVN